MQSNQPIEDQTDEIIAELDLDKLPQPQLTGHAWRQRGTELLCESCPTRHASYIPPDLQLYGIDTNGYPLVRRIRF